MDSRLTVIEAGTDRIKNIETALSQLTRKVDKIIERENPRSTMPIYEEQSSIYRKEIAEENTKEVLHKFTREELNIRKEIQLGTVKPEIKKQSISEQKTHQSTSLSGTPPTDNRKSQKRVRTRIRVVRRRSS
ncbi:Hypothetical predicted protein [Mytilus galloprovincialis]|uniref:Uncharacterized protein n=1 Tax=Mytilus galloprovincialis TaxID=29158 RepID=A0A8B6ECZ4_MYTGA|nr:Hypothetical predicted protein [Mytilus galloprovincialis]